MSFMSKLKQSRGASFVIITFVYILAAVAGVLIYKTLPYEVWLNLLIADVAATVVTYVFSVILSNASVYDPYWSVQPIVILLAFAIGTELNTLGVLLLVCVCYWGLRLTANWAYTFHGLTHQDWRYTMLSEKCGKLYQPVNFLGIHLVPTLIVYGCTLPAVFAFTEYIEFTPLCVVFSCLSVGAVTLQGRADIQMHRFRKNRTTTFIRTGLWKHSRHPNYLGEILMWWGIALTVISADPAYWYLCAGAVSNTLLFLFVSIPMADNRQSAKPGFAQYKEQTRMLLPIKKH